jgi:hypothetical protein
MSNVNRAYIRACVLAQLDWEDRRYNDDKSSAQELIKRADDLIEAVERAAAARALEEAAEAWEECLLSRKTPSDWLRSRAVQE